MRKILFTTIISITFHSILLAQNIQQIKSYSDDQFEKGNFQTALKEYQRVLLFDNELIFTDIYRKIATIYYQQNDFESAIKYFNLAWNVEQNDSLRYELIFLKSICHFKLNDNLSALNELFDLTENSSDYFLFKRDLFLGICYYGLNDYTTSLGYFTGLLDSSGVQQLNILFNDIEKFNKKFNPTKIEIMSYVFPGLGQVYAGKIGSGLNSFILLSGIAVYGLITMANYGFLDGILVLSSWFYRYYTGGTLSAKTIAQTKLEHKKSDNYSKILKIVENHQKL